MAPLGLNPQLLPQSTQLTTRAALYNEDERDLNLSSRDQEGWEAGMKLLDTIVQYSLGTFDIGSPNAKREKLPANSPENEVVTQVMPFRLISSDLPPYPISLLPAHHSSIPHQRPVEDTPHEQQLRHKRAQEVAVDADWILTRSSTEKRLTGRAPVTTLIPSSPGIKSSQLPSLFVTELTQKMSIPAIGTSEGPDRVKCCLLVPVTELTDKPQKRKRKRKFPKRDHPPLGFFRPMREWGGKSAGYALGWRSSWPARGPGPHRYIRDKMHKGITLARSLKEMD